MRPVGIKGAAVKGTAVSFAVLSLANCAAPVPEGSAVPQTLAFAEISEEETKIADLAAQITALGGGIDPDEAARIARISVEDPLQWAQDWDVVDPPYIHNIKVNQGKKPRGLCREWADDLQARLARENFQTVDWHRAIANHDNWLVEHSTLIVSFKGAAMEDGILLDPWRLGQGRLFYSKVDQDRRYRWVERSEVFAYKRERKAAKATSAGKTGL